MPDEQLDQLTERLNRSLSMTQTTGGTTSTSTLAGLTTLQRQQIASMIKDALDPSSEHLSDEGLDHPIGTVTNRLDELDKVPDIVKSLREFSGKPGEFNSWRKSVERVLGLYDSIKGNGRYYAILHTIRTKIVGDADTALESYRTPLDWPRIRKCLMMHYSDKRDIGTLEYQMTVLCQGNRTISEFYQAVYQHLSLILDKVSCLDLNENSIHAMTNTYREKALDTFIRGLNGDLPRLLSVPEPTSLKLDNMTFRMNYAHGQISRNNGQRDRIGVESYVKGKPRFYPELAHIGGRIPPRPPIPPRNFPFPNNNYAYYSNQNPGPRPHSYQSFRPNNQVTYNRFPNQNYQFQNPIQKPNPTQFQHPNQSMNYHKPPEPMEVDRSIQSRPIGRVTRPPMYNFSKRPGGTSFQGPANKVQRNFHIDANYIPEDALYGWCYYPPEGYEVDTPPQDGEPGYLQEYVQQIPEEEASAAEYQEDQPEEVEVAVNFLD